MSASYVYFLRPVGAYGPIKIGRSTEPSSRLKTFCAWSPMPLEIVAEVPGDWRLEQWLHAKFANQRMHGEWFEVCVDLVDGIEKLASGSTLAEAFGNVDLPTKRMHVGKRQSIERRAYLKMAFAVSKRVRLLKMDSRPTTVDYILNNWGRYTINPWDGRRPHLYEMAFLKQFASGAGETA